MKPTLPAHPEERARELQDYLSARPELLLRLLDVAEARWRERDARADQQCA